MFSFSFSIFQTANKDSNASKNELKKKKNREQKDQKISLLWDKAEGGKRQIPDVKLLGRSSFERAL